MKRTINFLIMILAIIALSGCVGAITDIPSLAETPVITPPASLPPTIHTAAPSTAAPPTTKPPAAPKPTASSPSATVQKPSTPSATALSLGGEFTILEINGLSLKIDPQTGSAEYLDPQGRTVLQVNALPLKDSSPHTTQLKGLLDQIYGPDSPYVQSGVYPRFTYPQPGIQSSFFAIDKNLTASQVLLLKEALALFSRPVFAPLVPDLFDPGIAYVLIDRITGDTAGLTYAGTGVVELDRRDLFGNKYLLASVIAHEGSHVLQGPVANGGGCADMLSREIGNRTIPSGFYQWDAATLLQAIKDRQIGAYHVSLWMLTQLGVKDSYGVLQAIQTGLVNGTSVVNCQQ